MPVLVELLSLKAAALLLLQLGALAGVDAVLVIVDSAMYWSIVGGFVVQSFGDFSRSGVTLKNLTCVACMFAGGSVGWIQKAPITKHCNNRLSYNAAATLNLLICLFVGWLVGGVVCRRCIRLDFYQ